METIKTKQVAVLLGIFLFLEIISIFGFSFSFVNQSAFFILVLITLVLSIYKLEYGLLLVLAELMIGSKGYLFYLPLGEGSLLSLRLVIWSILMIVFLIKFLISLKKLGYESPYFKKIKDFVFWKPYLILAILVLTGLVSAIIYKNNLIDIFLDFNAWIYFLILFPAISVNINRQRLETIFIAGAIWISLKTLILLAIFSNDFTFAANVYAWLRKTLVGEMTASSNWNRVFIQSQIFSIIAYFFLFFKIIKINNLKSFFNKQNILNFVLMALFFSTLLISLSRSFWLGFAAVILFSLIFTWRFYSFKRAALIALEMTLGVVLAVIMIFVAAPHLTGLQSQLLNRVGNKEEAALVSRWTLLPELIKEIKNNPISGQGYGKTVTYISSDPRILENEASGRYTTYAFEWGYLDIWLKIGVLGLIAYLLLLYKVIHASLMSGIKSGDYLYLGITAGCLFLAIVHFFTPYLNHPLGIGFIVISSCLILKDRVY
ncbi:MAG: O-antigen ligase family protein [Patescibacteria group bacterium]